MRRPVTPQATFRFERRLARLLWELGRRVVQQVYNSLEPEDATRRPGRVRLGLDEYRRNRKTRTTLACLFGNITLRRFVYQAVQAGEAALFPLEYALGVTAGQATPALADVAGRLVADLPQQQTLAVLAERYRVRWSVGTLRKVTAALAEALSPLRHESQLAQVLEMLTKAQASSGKHAVSLVAGRDGVMVPTRPCWEEAATATLSVYDRQGKRVGTVYLGQMPQSKQLTLSQQFTELITAVLSAWQGPLPRLHYVTDAGTLPQDFYHQVLSKMKHPRTGRRLSWSWSVDYYHAAQRLTTLAEALFGAGVEAEAWAQKMRRVLKTKTQGVQRVLQSARSLCRSRGLQQSRREFETALAYLTKYRRYLDYAGYRHQGLPIGSGVTEAACKTIFTQRFKLSGMRWHRATGQHVLDLRVILKSGVWERVRDNWLNAFQACQSNDCRRQPTTEAKNSLEYTLPR